MDECSNTGRKLSELAWKHPVLQSGSARKGGELNCHLGLRRFSGRQPHSLINFLFGLKGYKYISSNSEKRLLWTSRKHFLISSAEVTARHYVISL